jgi:hypothetical protein
MFELGTLVATPAALRAFETEGVKPLPYITRHSGGDWGDLGSSDKRANDFAVVHGGRIFSAYVLPTSKIKIWIITEASRDSTTILLPEDY